MKGTPIGFALAFASLIGTIVGAGRGIRRPLPPAPAIVRADTDTSWGCRWAFVRRVRLYGQIVEARGDTSVIVMLCGPGQRFDSLLKITHRSDSKPTVHSDTVSN